MGDEHLWLGYLSDARPWVSCVSVQRRPSGSEMKPHKSTHRLGRMLRKRQHFSSEIVSE